MRLPLIFVRLSCDDLNRSALLILWEIKLTTYGHIYTNQWNFCHNSIQLREILRKWLCADYEFTHFVTLNFHRKHTPERAKRFVRLWFKNVQDRLMKPARFRGRAPSEVFFFFAFPEDTLHDEPHFHLLTRVAPESTDYFERLASRLWTNCVSSGTCDVQPILDADSDRAKVVSYATKNVHRHFSSSAYFPSTEFEDACSTSQCGLKMNGAKK